MPRERRVQAQAELGERYRAQGGAGVSPWLVAGIVVLALSLVAIGALVVVRSLRGDLPGVARAPDPTPTPTRPTPGVFTVGKQGSANGIERRAPRGRRPGWWPASSCSR